MSVALTRGTLFSPNIQPAPNDIEIEDINQGIAHPPGILIIDENQINNDNDDGDDIDPTPPAPPSSPRFN